MRIASYNIRKAVGLDWRRDPGRIMDVLVEMDADIVLLQEADKRIGARAGVLPTRQLAELGYAFADVAIRPLSHGWHGNAILVKDGLRIAWAERIVLPAFEPRGAVAVRLVEPNLMVIGAHLALGSRSRARQAATLRDCMERAGCQVVLGGDFNEWRAMGPILRNFGDGFEHVIPGSSFHAAHPIASLDRFVLHGALRCKESAVHRSPLAARASDHLPVFVDLEVGA